MVHNDVLLKFKELTHVPDNVIDVWFPNGYNSIRVRLINKAELVFTYTNDRKWRIETIAEFLSRKDDGK